MIGRQFGKLTVMEEAGVNKHHQRMYKCLCECGNTTTVTSNNLLKQNTTSCGCNKKRNYRALENKIKELEKKLANQLVAD